MSDLTPKENTALDVAMTRLGELVDRMEKAAHPYPRERTWPDAEAELVQAKTEIERITKLCQDAVVDAEIIQIERLKAEAEIERLRLELSHCLHLDNHNAIVCNLQEAAVVVTAEKDAEIERLREANIRHNAWFQEEVERRAAAERKQHAAEDEAERLRDSLVIANTTQANLHSEIDKLRGLLREVLNCGASYRAAEYDEVQIPHELDNAISEALGD